MKAAGASKKGFQQLLVAIGAGFWKLLLTVLVQYA